ncbi:carbon storage regulator CsrA [Paenibacillus contaminans]|uniref:Translational regulator CsrA n=1 Tax=Paenibacillus contaminans TaxID=450362 RepID=A0A329MFG8_9BACL|nr:carbon storage regulator CsrA [Paenibacillus contaminans]RAV17403.1 carbon storage regulator [Paenibacillus contaminans]
MLVLSRKKGESIVIAGNIELVVLGTEGDNVRLGIKAPKDVEVYRKELFQAIQEQNVAAASNNRIDPMRISKLFKKN